MGRGTTGERRAGQWLTDEAVARAARLAGAVIRVTGRGQGATLPGLLAERVAPGVTRRRARRLERVVLVSGTNGKTTTTAMLTAALAADGRRVATNASGSNLYRGLTTAMLEAGPAAQDGVLEVDEAVLPLAIDELWPRLVVLLNLTRDQLDRHHEVQGLAGRWRAAVGRLPADATVVADVGDPKVAWVASAAPWAVHVALCGRRAGPDGAACPACGGVLGTGPSGWYRCWMCGWSPPAATVRVERQDDEIRLLGEGVRRRADLLVPTDGCALDVALAWAAASRLGADPDRSLAAIGRLGAVQYRYGDAVYRGVPVRLLLAKNPAGWDEALTASPDPARPAVVSVNGGGPDGRDTSWLWDVDMARLSDRPFVVATGARAEDVALRLEVAGVTCSVVRPLGEAISRAGRSPGNRQVDLFMDYTSFVEARELASRHG